MNYIVASIVLLISIAAGVIAVIKLNIEGNTPKQDKNSLTAPIYIDILKNIQTKDWIVISCSALIIVFLTYCFESIEMTYIEQVRFLSVAIILIPTMIIDWYTHRIPNILILIMLGIGGCILLLEYFLYPDAFFYNAIKGLIGLLICVVLFYVLSRLTKDGIGMGDVKLIAAMGWVVGLSLTITAVIFALIICSIFAVYLLIGKKKNKNDQIAFGPFMFLGYICTLLLFIL